MPLPNLPEFKAAFSPLTRIFPESATPELRRLQSELGARHSFREAARLPNELTPCARQNHTTIRNRLASVAECLEFREDEASKDVGVQSSPSEVTVFLDSAYVRSRPEHQRRNLEVIVGSMASEMGKKRRFGLTQAGTDRPVASLRSNLEAAGWRDGVSATVLSDGDPGLPRLVGNATGAEVHHVLDWRHVSARIKHVEATFQTVLSQLESDGAAQIDALAERLRWRIWHGQVNRAPDAPDTLFRFAMRVREFTIGGTTIGGTGEAAMSAAARVMDLQTYLKYNLSAVVDYGCRRRQGKAVSTSRAEGLANEIANVRMGKKQRMRWSPGRAHRAATVRAAVLDGRPSTGRLSAA